MLTGRVNMTCTPSKSLTRRNTILGACSLCSPDSSGVYHCHALAIHLGRTGTAQGQQGEAWVSSQPCVREIRLLHAASQHDSHTTRQNSGSWGQVRANGAHNHRMWLSGASWLDRLKSRSTGFIKREGSLRFFMPKLHFCAALAAKI